MNRCTATAELIASGAAARAAKVGDKAPAFSLKDADGNEVSSSTELLSQGPLIVTYYRGAWCPYCNMDLQALQGALPELEKSGIQLVAISPQTAANSRRSMRENKLTFPILSDPHNAVAAASAFASGCPITSSTSTGMSSRTTSHSSTETRTGRCRCRRVLSSAKTESFSTLK
jgi:peroxiredoxin